MARRNDPTGVLARRRARKWLAVTAMAPVLALPAALLSASALPTGPGGPQTSDLRELGVSGNLPQAPVLSHRLLNDAADPAQLAAVPQAAPRAELPTGELGIPEPVLAAYMQAAREVEQIQACGLHWSVLASIGRIESGHARNGDIDVNGTTVHAILGPQLSGGPNVAAIPDTDAGHFDGDRVWDRAVGPMQFIPSTWRKFAADGNQDGVENPHNVPDAAAASGTYLCSGGEDLNDPRALAAAVFRYNHSESYVRTVLVWADAYRRGVTPTPAELAPETGDVLAGARVTDSPSALALPEPEPLSIPEIEPVAPIPDPQPQAFQPVPETSGAQPAPAPAQPEPEPEPLVDPVEPVVPQELSIAPVDPVVPQEPSIRPAPETTAPSQPPSSEPAPPSAELLPQSAVPAPQSPEPLPQSSVPTPPSSEPVPSTSSPEPFPSSSTSEVGETCDTTLLDRGEFALVAPAAGHDLRPGESLPMLAQPEVEVFTDAGGSAKPCTVPDGYTPEPQ
ncbi:lytic murein transglycosylase [Saccharopolyspora sp. NPDC049426]|uniref:lytic transglycosylase domain-containing protein n=1 Tax=Saccharopolyspora sp. NPDC049426 TaxID=3155652 RepID=UPI003438FCEA